jgi:hypothetical protein
MPNLPPGGSDPTLILLSTIKTKKAELLSNFTAL